MNDPDLDRILSARLPAVADAGFSRAVMARVAAMQQRRMFVELAAIMTGLAMLLALIPLKALNSTIETVALNLGSSLPVAVAFAALALSLAYARISADVG
jgi:hypothetical protein